MSSIARLTIPFLMLIAALVGCKTTHEGGSGADWTEIQAELEARDRRISQLESQLASLASSSGGSVMVSSSAGCGSDGSVTLQHSGPANAVRGANVQYTLRVANPHNCPAASVQVLAYIPTNAAFVGASNGGSLSGRVIQWSMPKLDGGQSVELTYTLRLEATGVYRPCAYASAKLLDCVETRIVEPKLACNWTGPGKARKGEVFELCLEISNSGDGDAPGVTAQIRLSGMEFVDGGSSKTWGNLTVGAGQSVRNCWQVRATADGNGEVTAEITGAGTSRCGKTVMISTPDLRIQKTAPPQVKVNSSFRYKITVSNPSSAMNTNVTVTDPLPAGMEFVNADNGGTYDSATRTVTWNLGNLGPRESREMSIMVKAVQEKEAPGWRNCASVRSSELPPREDCANTIVEAIPAMHIDSFDTEDPVQVGDQTTYVVKVRNEGQRRATNMRMTFMIPAEAEYVSHRVKVGGVNGSYEAAGRRVVFDGVPVMQPGDAVIYEITVRATSPGDALGVAVVRYNEFSKPFRVEEPTNLYE